MLAAGALAGSVEARWGPVARLRDDQVFSDVAFGGVSPIRLGLAAEAGTRTRHRVDLALDLTGARAGRPYAADRTDGPAFVVGSSPFGRLDLRWTSTWTVSGPLRVGFALDNRIDTTSYDHGFTGAFGYMATFGAGPAAAATFDPTDRLSVDVGGSFPVAAWVARSPWGINDDPFIRAIASHDAASTFGALIGHGSVQTVNRLQSLLVHAALSQDLGARWALVARAELAVLHHTRPRPLTDVAATLEAGVAGRW